MTPADRLAAIRARVEAATPGPWEVHKSDVIRVLPDPTTGEPEPHLVAQSWPVDASFIAHARTDIPALLAAVEAALRMHSPVPVYEFATECPECISGEHEDVIDDIYGEPLCPASPTGEHFCDECSHEDHSCEPIPFPCPTVRAITEALT